MPQSVNQLSTPPDACCDQGVMGGFRVGQDRWEWLSGLTDVTCMESRSSRCSGSIARDQDVDCRDLRKPGAIPSVTCHG